MNRLKEKLKSLLTERRRKLAIFCKYEFTLKSKSKVKILKQGYRRACDGFVEQNSVELRFRLKMTLFCYEN